MKNNVQIIGDHRYKYRRFQVNPDYQDIDVPDGDPLRGEWIYKNYCAGCHDLDSEQQQGPSLRQVYMRKAGTRKGYRYYSSTMPSYHFYWTRNILDQFIENPEKTFPDTNMFFDGLRDSYDRACIIEYLHYLRAETDGTQRRLSRKII
ncbi:hypothetical protein ABPG72_007709 [Tetrahymena utriculariae]